MIRASSGMSSPFEAARIALAVDPLVVGEDDLGDRAVAVERGDDPRALLRVALDQHPVLVGERHVGLEDPVGEDELADVVQQRGDVDELLLAGASSRPAGRSPASSARRRREWRAVIWSRRSRVRSSALNIPTWKLASCLLRTSSSSARSWDCEQGAEQVLEGDEDDAEQGDPGEPDLDVDEGDADRHQRRRELGGQQRDERPCGPSRGRSCARGSRCRRRSS